MGAMFNYTVAKDTGPWRRAAVSILPPACLPVALHNAGAAYRIESRYEWILPAAIRHGVELTVNQLKSIIATLGVPLPDKGSGKRGQLIKTDFAQSLIKYLFPNAEGKEFDRMLKDTLGGSAKTGPTDVEVLAAMAELDTENAEAFIHVKKQALEQFEAALFGHGKKCGIEHAESEEKARKIKQKADAKAKELREREKREQQALRRKQFELTPPELKRLLPGAGSITSVFWGRYNPMQKFFRFDYPVGDLLNISWSLLFFTV